MTEGGGIEDGRPPIRLPALAIVALCLAGCAAASEPIAATESAGAFAPRVSGSSGASVTPREDGSSQGNLRLSPQLRERDEPDPELAPYVVIKIDAKTGQLTDEMQKRLLKVVEEAKRDSRIIVRIEGYVPSGGSPAMDVGRADGHLQIVKDSLQRLGVSPRRMLLASFGAEHELELDAHRPWVEIYLIETGRASSNAETSAGK